MEELALLLGALRSAMWGEALPHASVPEVWRRVFSLARAHDLSLLVSEGLERGGVTLSDGVSEAFVRAGAAAFGRYCSQNLAMERLRVAFEAQGIDYMPLKGAVLRELYPVPEWRVGRDLDILVRQSDFSRARAIVAKVLSPVSETEGGHDVAFEMADGVRIELHFALFNGNEGFGELLSDPFLHAQPSTDGSHCYRLPDAELYAYLVAHMAKHFQNGGCGIRAFLDLHLLALHIGEEACARGDAMLTACGLSGFARVVRRQCRVFFADEEGDEDTERLTRFVAENQAFGTHASDATVQKSRGKKKTGGIGYFFARAFPPYRAMCYLYPILRRLPILLPFCWILRGFRLFSKKDRARFVRATRARFAVEDSAVAEVSRLYSYLEL